MKSIGLIAIVACCGLHKSIVAANNENRYNHDYYDQDDRYNYGYYDEDDRYNYGYDNYNYGNRGNNHGNWGPRCPPPFTVTETTHEVVTQVSTQFVESTAYITLIETEIILDTETEYEIVYHSKKKYATRTEYDTLTETTTEHRTSTVYVTLKEIVTKDARRDRYY